MEFREGPIEGVIERPIRFNRDGRGWLAEVFRWDELPPDVRPQMGYVSETLPGVARGPHEHRQQTDVFVFMGPGEFAVYLWDNRPGSPTYGNRRRYIAGERSPLLLVVPAGVVHGYKNVSDRPGWVFNFPTALYKGWNRTEPVDEIRHEHRNDSPFQIE